MDSIQTFWADIMKIPGAGVVLGLFGLLTVVLIAIYVLKGVREMALGGGEDSLNSISHLTEFERLRAEGKLNDEEFQRLKKAVPQNIMPSVVPKTNQSNPSLSSNRNPNQAPNSTPDLPPPLTNNSNNSDPAPDFTEAESDATAEQQPDSSDDTK